ncbi:MAG: glycosyltransferase family 2 protein [Bacteroidota bacterium]
MPPTATVLPTTSAPPRVAAGSGTAVDHRADTLDVSVVIVNYNVRGFLEQALSSVQRAVRGLRAEVFVVDNNSVDGSVAMVRERFPDVHVIANRENVGFARANNQAIREARGRLLFILNPDTLVQEDTIERMVAFMDAHPDAGAVGCRILNPDGTFAPESRRAFPTPSVAFYRMTGLARLFPHSPTFGRYNLTYLPKDEVCEVDALSGSCMLVRAEALRGAGPHVEDPTRTEGAGLFDESFFMYGEDLDWCYRIQQAGWRIYYTPDTQLIHYKGECTKKGELRYVRLFYGAMIKFSEKHFSGDTALKPRARLSGAVLRWAIRLAVTLRAALSLAVRAVRATAAPAFEFALAWGAMAAATGLWSTARGVAFEATFYFSVLPLYALGAIAAIGLARGYGRGRHRLRPLVTGLSSAFVTVATVSFFLPAIQFSRGAVLFGFAAAAAFLLVGRLALHLRAREARSVLLVGDAAEATRLHRMLAGRPRSRLKLLGFVAREENGPTDNGPANDGTVLRLGAPHHLRDLVRLRGVHEVVFAADSLTNTGILRLMRDLRHLPVQFKILVHNHDRLIGKASVDDFSMPLLDAERTIPPLRSGSRRLLLDVPVALVGTAMHPLCRLLARLRPTARMRSLACATAMMPSVLAGRRALVGYDASIATRPPEAWALQPGLVSILDTLPTRPTGIVEVHRAYWFYARHQSFWLDLEILGRALIRTPKGC